MSEQRLQVTYAMDGTDRVLTAIETAICEIVMADPRNVDVLDKADNVRLRTLTFVLNAEAMELALARISTGLLPPGVVVGGPAQIEEAAVKLVQDIGKLVSDSFMAEPESERVRPPVRPLAAPVKSKPTPSAPAKSRRTMRGRNK